MGMKRSKRRGATPEEMVMAGIGTDGPAIETMLDEKIKNPAVVWGTQVLVAQGLMHEAPLAQALMRASAGTIYQHRAPAWYHKLARKVVQSYRMRHHGGTV